MNEMRVIVSSELNPIDRLSDRLESIRVVHNMAVIGAQVETKRCLMERKELAGRLNDLKKNVADLNEVRSEDQGPEGSIEVIEAEVAYLDGTVSRVGEVEPNSKANYAISMVSAFEVFLGELLDSAFHRCPRCMMNNSSTLTDEMLVKAIIDDDVLDTLVSTRVRKIMSENLLKCGITFNSILGVDAARVSELKELVQVRNCLVHNDGRPSPELVRDFPNYGSLSKIILDDAWLNDHHRRIIIVANELWTNVWLKLSPECDSGNSQS